MRRPVILVPMAILCTASTAHANEHRMQVVEVLLSDNADNTVQYVEMKDTAVGGEGFPGNAFQLGVYDADGVLIGNVPLTIGAVAGNTTDWFVPTAAAVADFGQTGDGTPTPDVLTVALPTNGQVCFQDAAIKIHCVAWGCINTLAGTAVQTGRGESPGDGTSLQRNASGTYFVGTPTPKMANLNGVPGDFCPTDPDAGVGVAPDAMPIDSQPGTAPDANPAAGDDTGGGGGCCRVGGQGGAGGAIVLALSTMLLVRRRATRR